MSDADDQMEALAVSIQQTDMSSLTEVPDEEKASLLPAAGTSEAVVEPKWVTADVPREKKPPIPCMLPMRRKRNGQDVPCRDKTFTRWAALKKHHTNFHAEETWPEWVNGKPVLRINEGPNLFEGYEEDPGPLVVCRCILFLLFKHSDCDVSLG